MSKLPIRTEASRVHGFLQSCIEENNRTTDRLCEKRLGDSHILTPTVQRKYPGGGRQRPKGRYIGNATGVAKMTALWFKIENSENLCYELAEVTHHETICGGLEEHGGLMGVMSDHSGRLYWYLALINPFDISGPGLLKLEYNLPNPSPQVMRRVFAILDRCLAETIEQPKSEDYPTLTETLEVV